MKYLYLIVLATLLSCSKSKSDTNDPNAIPISVNAKVIDVKWWALSIQADRAITTTGTVTAEWDVYNDSDVFLYKKSGTVTFSFNNAMATSFEKSATQGALSMKAKNGKILSITASGNYKFKY